MQLFPVEKKTLTSHENADWSQTLEKKKHENKHQPHVKMLPDG